MRRAVNSIFNVFSSESAMDTALLFIDAKPAFILLEFTTAMRCFLFYPLVRHCATCSIACSPGPSSLSGWMATSGSERMPS